jgi:hypothetical protein
MQKHWLQSAPWETVLTVNQALCKAQKLDPTTNARTFDAARQLWESAAARSLTLKEVLDVCRECQEKLPFTFNNGNTFTAVARTLLEDATKKMPPVEAQILHTTVCHYIAGLVGKRELLQVLKHFESNLQPEPVVAESSRPERVVVPHPTAAPMLTEAHPRA